MKESLKLYLVTDRTLSAGRSLEEVVEDAVAGGVTMVQLREKETATGEFVELAMRLKKLHKPYGVPLIINDRVDVALACDADGVHIGQSDMPYEIARRLLGPDKMIGLSVESVGELLDANGTDVDYVAVSPVYGTPTKTDTAKPFGLDGLQEAVRLSLHPVVAIGGMNIDTAPDVIRTGCDGIAVVSAISSATSPRDAASQLRAIVESNATERWSRQAWSASAKIYDAILRHGFIKELSAGTLSLERFARYIGQDEVYLKNYYVHMMQMSDMMETHEDKMLFTAFAASGMEGEKRMHDFLIDKYGIDTDVRASVVTEGYNALIQSAADSGNPCLALAAMLPCMWIYNRVGLHILDSAALEDNPYREWIMEYGNEDFTGGVNAVLDMIDGWASKADEQTKSEMTRLFLRAALYEYAFWDYGYAGEESTYDYADSLDGWI